MAGTTMLALIQISELGITFLAEHLDEFVCRCQLAVAGWRVVMIVSSTLPIRSRLCG
jgi:hypothetical protein